MAFGRFVLLYVVVALLASACSASINGADGTQLVVDTNNDDDYPTQEEVDAFDALVARDDVAVRLVEAAPVASDGSSVLSAEVFGVLGEHGDSMVSLPSLELLVVPGVTFSNFPDGCMIVSSGVSCAVDSLEVVPGANSTVETNSLLFEFEYSVSADVELPLVFELSASSFNNPVENDPDPSNNTITVEVEAG